MEVIEAIRANVTSNFILSVRMTGDELNPKGLTLSDCISIAKQLDASGHVDLLNLLLGSAYDDIGLAQWVPPMGFHSTNPYPITAAIRQAVSIPVMYAGGISDIATANHAMANGLGASPRRTAYMCQFVKHASLSKTP